MVDPDVIEHDHESAVIEVVAALVRPRLRGRFHAIATILSLGALVWLVESATTAAATVAAWVYGVAAILCYLTSSSYHSIANHGRARTLMRRADHSMIYVLIAGTFTPVCILAMAGWWRWLLLGAVWAGALAGVVRALAAFDRLPRLGIALYLILGWAGVAAMPALLRQPTLLVLVVTAGVLYTVGAILFGRQVPRLHPGWFGYHEFWHTIGIVAGALLFVVNLKLVSAGS